MSILRRIKREARNSPAKAAVLVALIGLAVYAWAPLAVGLIPTDKRSAEPTRSDDAEVAVAASPEAGLLTPGETGAVAGPTWRQLRQWCDDSPWAAPADLSQVRDPFRNRQAKEESSDSGQETEPSTVTPGQAIGGLPVELTGTIVSPRGRVAILNGRAYREGDTIVVDHLGTSWKLEIRQVRANWVTLGWESIERELVVPQRPPVGQIELVRRSREQKGNSPERTAE